MDIVIRIYNLTSKDWIFENVLFTMAEKHNTLINSLLKWISIDQFFLASICRNFFTQNAWFIFLADCCRA